VARVRYELNAAGVGELLRSHAMLDAMVDTAREIKYIAEATAPVDSGDYVGSFRITSTNFGGPKGDRAQATLENYSDHAFYVEFGTSRFKGFHTIFNAAQAAGGA